MIIVAIYTKLRASLVAQTVKNPPAMQETPVQSLGQEDPLERRVVWMWFGAFPGAFGLGRAQPQRRGTSP